MATPSPPQMHDKSYNLLFVFLHHISTVNKMHSVYGLTAFVLHQKIKSVHRRIVILFFCAIQIHLLTYIEFNKICKFEITPKFYTLLPTPRALLVLEVACTVHFAVDSAYFHTFTTSPRGHNAGLVGFQFYC